eukprot:TRINITY_DN7580_c0_g1_i2.p1 TRINITY_DN7580_c0_g1~~TRINITY_DN7580_c0_g1_i2.p1  ORF type:complete len:173 (-),score=33.22 TRINITY_DN7580_c0_g1_i2:117-635(-)
MTLDELQKLHKLCDSYRDVLLLQNQQRFEPNQISLVLFKNRALSRRVMTAHIPITPKYNIEQSSGTTPSLSPSPLVIDESSQKYVDTVLSEFENSDNLPTYLSNVNAPGYHAPHYLNDHCEATLVCFLSSSSSSRELFKIIQQFRQDVDSLLPGLYEWFDDQDLHMTVRAIN